MTSWRVISPADAGEVCPWPWEPQQRIGIPLGQYHCLYCGAMRTAGLPHPDYREETGDGTQLH